MRPEDLWIGDPVRIIKSGRTGSYEGKSKDGRARIKSNGKIYLVDHSKISLHTEEKASNSATIPYAEETNTAFSLKTALSVPKSLDLHIEVLHPALTHEAPQIILNHQISRCEMYIDSAIRAGAKVITIIHGHGTGQLRREVEHLLSMRDEVRYHIPAMSGAATEVWLE